MAKQYWVGDIYVDLSRNQVSHLGQSDTVPPKALQVLTCLAKRQGKVVSHQEILDEVWPNAFISPNTLQSSIAQLRKVLSRRRQSVEFIKTHAKQGYSLECEVRWPDTHSCEEEQIAFALNEQSEAMQPNDRESANTTHASFSSIDSSQNPIALINKQKHYFYWLFAIATVLVVAIAVSERQNHATQFSFSDLRYLTATDDNEFGASYTADGKFILFNRYNEQLCTNKIWAKNTETLEEIQLTREIGTYEGHTLSPDGNTLIYIEQDNCTQPVHQNICFRLMKLDFTKALSKEPQPPSILLDCQNSAINTPIWVDDHHIVMRQKYNRHWRLIRYSIANNTSSVLYEMTDGHVSSVAWSPQQALFAVSSLKSDGLQYIEMLLADGEVKSSHRVQLPENSPKYLKIAPQFMPNSEQLIFSFGSELFTMAHHGEVNKVSIPFDANIDTTQFHPDGDRLLLVKGLFDSDVASLTIPLTDTDLPQKQNLVVDMSVFERSGASEHVATFQPGGNAIAFASARTGTDQVWLRDDNGTKVISDLPKGSFIQNLLWSSDGTSLLVYANWQMHKLSPYSNAITVDFPYLITDLFHWDSSDNSVVANILVDGISKFVNIHLSSLEYEVINNKNVIWAVKTPQGKLIYRDERNRFWQPGAIEHQLIEPFTELGSSKRFLHSNHVIYGINKANQLWSYHLQSGNFNIIANVSNEIDYLTDIQGNKVLTTLAVDAKKEVIELTLAD